MLDSLNIRDKNIVSRSFKFLSPNLKDPSKVFKQADYDLETSFFSTAVGDNRFINSLPGYGINTDPSPGLVYKNAIKNEYYNLGRYFKRIHDDNATVLTLTAGTAEFSGILEFITNMFDYSASLIANKGRAPSFIFYITSGMSAIAFWPFQVIGVGLNFLNFLFDSPKNQWYYVKPAMAKYLNAAQGIFNDLMVTAGYSMTVLNSSKQETGNNKKGDADFYKGTINGYDAKDSHDAKRNNIEFMNRLYPDAIDKNGLIDITRLAFRGPRKYRLFLKALKDLDEKNGNRKITVEEKDKLIEETLQSLVKDPQFMNDRGRTNYSTKQFLDRENNTVGQYRGIDEIGAPEMASSYYDTEVAASVIPTSKAKQSSVSPELTNVNSIRNKFDYLNDNNNTNEAPPAGSQNASGNFNTDTSLNGDVPNEQINVNKPVSKEHWFKQVGDYILDGLMGGMDAISFRVEGSDGSVTDSFSNSTQQSEIAGFFNNSVQAVNNFKFNVQGGATGIEVIDTFANMIKDGLAGFASGSVIGNIPLALMGNSRITVPEHWADSSTNLHTESYQIVCRALYGHPYCIATNIFLPLALIAPFVFPVCTGGSSYTTPFLVKAFCRGRTIIKTGIVKNATFTFGEGELGWTRDRKPLNLRINLDIADLDPILSVPVTRMTNPMEIANPTLLTNRYLNDVGKYNDWLARVGGVDYLDTVLKRSRLNRVVTRATNDFNQIFNPANIANAVTDSVVSDAARLFTMRSLNR